MFNNSLIIETYPNNKNKLSTKKQYHLGSQYHINLNLVDKSWLGYENSFK